MMTRFLLMLILAILNLPISASAMIIDSDAPNEIIISKAFGFMLLGNQGFMAPNIENLSVKGCEIKFEQNGGIYSHAIQKIFVKYDLSKANWNSAVYVPNYFEDVVYFEVYGDKGLRELNYQHSFANEEELRIGLALIGLSEGTLTDIKIKLPSYITKERYDRAYWDLREQCPGIQGDY